ncbi:MAG: hypothetical protein ACR2J1_05430 [Methyloceanibacter sp.]|uniref:hypothetical protein n=1 Tax=Methyloceanibacter sp. TaxID=1965321 RepID=UPI003D9BA887
MDKIPAIMLETTTRMAVAASVITAGFALTLVGGCGTIGSSRNKEGAATDIEARTVKPDDPLARPIQVAWTSARASYCGFIFDPGQLRANYLASESRAGTPPAQMQKIERAYDYTRQSVIDTIKDNLSYCNKERTAAIRADLTRYLAGDYAPHAKVAR